MSRETLSVFGILGRGVCNKESMSIQKGKWATIRKSRVPSRSPTQHATHWKAPTTQPVPPFSLNSLCVSWTYVITVHATPVSSLLSPRLPKLKARIPWLKENNQDINMKSHHLVLARRQEGWRNNFNSVKPINVGCWSPGHHGVAPSRAHGFWWWMSCRGGKRFSGPS